MKIEPEDLQPFRDLFREEPASGLQAVSTDPGRPALDTECNALLRSLARQGLSGSYVWIMPIKDIRSERVSTENIPSTALFYICNPMQRPLHGVGKHDEG